MSSPYSDLESRAFWRAAVGERSALDPGDLYRPKFQIPRKARIATAGSCFAQHVGRSLRNAGARVIDDEQLPAAISDDEAQRYGYRLYSARYGNIYTTRQLLQLHREAYGEFEPAEPVWEKDGRYFDSQRPSVEPEGLESPEAVRRHRDTHLQSVRRAFEAANVIVFTFGLTETWEHRATGTIYPTAPGTIAGTFDPEAYAFKNFGFNEVKRDFVAFRERVHAHNPQTKFVVTVSPVPLTATASGQHVEVATSYSKSVLRSVCGYLYQRYPDIEYFPSYEIITSSNNRGAYFENNKRSVSDKGVQTAMNMFLSAQGFSVTPPVIAEASGTSHTTQPGNTEPAGTENSSAANKSADVVCEEELLDAFAK